ncbi:hypothetical protein [Ralstonia solanacearum]|uniref:hypothetical protein n=1 Tax=Ralstonia solanacearum TaxID=305 RepID=UPI001E548DB8|nr:hypothetical protein [Ralstonia solanacearum]
MDYPIEPIDAIERRGRSAMCNGLEPEMCPYDYDTAHWRAWQLGYVAAALEAAHAAVACVDDEVVA